MQLLYKEQKKENQLAAIILMTLSHILFPCSYIYASEQNLSIAQANLLRGIVLIIICIVIAKSKNIDLERSIRTNFKSFAIRNLIVLLHMYAIFLCHYYLSVSVLQTINTVGPILVFVWDYYLHGIRINRKQFYGVVLGIVGLLITTNALQIYNIFVPQFKTGSTFRNYHSDSLQTSLLFAFFLLFANILWSYTVSMIKTIKMKDSAQMNYHLSLIMLISSGINYCLVPIQTKPIQIYAGAMLFTSLPIGIAQILFVKSLTLSRNAGMLTLFSVIAIIVGYCFSIFRYNENVNPIAVIGSILMVAGLFIVVLNKQKI